MRLVYTQKGLQFRRELKQDIYNTSKLANCKSNPNLKKLSSKLNPSQMHPSNSALKVTMLNETNGSTNLPNFDSIKPEFLQTTRGETINKPLLMAGQAHQMNSNRATTDKRSSGRRRLKSSSILDIISIEESPSHWRYFENKKRKHGFVISPDPKLQTVRQVSCQKQRFFSPSASATNFNKFESQYPFNAEKIYRKHAQEQEKRQKIR